MSGGFKFSEPENHFGKLFVLHDLRENQRFYFSHFVCAVFIAQYFVYSPQRPSQGWIKMIFNGVIGPKLSFKKIPAGEKFGDVFPTVSPFLVCFEDNLFLLFGPNFAVNFGIKMIVPPEILKEIPLSTLFARSIEFYFLGDECPVFCSVFLYEFLYALIFLR